MQETSIKKKRGILDNFNWVRKSYDKVMGKKYHLHMWVYVILAIVVPFISMAFPSVAVGVIQSEWMPAYMLGIIVLYAIIMKVANVGLAYADNAYVMDMFLGRIDVASGLKNHVVKMDYEKWESKEGAKLLEEAIACVYRGNEWGVEYFYARFPKILINFVGLVIYSIIVWNISPWILLYMVISAVIIAALGLYRDMYEIKQMDSMEKLHIRASYVFKETLAKETRHDIMLYHAKEWMLRNINKVLEGFDKYFKGFYGLWRASGISTAVLNFVRDLVVYIILIDRLSNGLLTVEELLLYIGAIAGYAAWVKEFMSATLAVKTQNSVITQYRDFLEFGVLEKKEIIPEFAKVQGQAHEIRFENVSYRYDGNEDMTLKNINLTLHKGEKVALVGENGAGKTTLVKLLTGLYTPTEGRIYMDGMDITDLDKETYFDEFSVVFQDSIVVASSIAENIACCSDYEEEKVIACLKNAGLYEKVQSMKDGIHTMLTRNLDPEGEELSGGETQKLMLARALYRNTSNLILDEPTAALDPLAESNMYETYTSFGKEKTSVFISHRLSSTRFCDRICFLQDGEIVEEGTHEELMSAKGSYANMFSIQAKYYKEQEEKNHEAEV